MVGATRGNPEGFGDANGSSSQRPPPPPPNFAEYLAAQTELLRQLVQGQQQQQQQRGGPNVHQPQAAGYPEFLATQPPLFNKTEEPLDADAWIHTIKSKFSLLLVPCSEQNKARFAAHSFAVRHVFGGITTLACSQLITLPLGMNSRLHSRVTIFQKDSWIGS